MERTAIKVKKRDHMLLVVTERQYWHKRINQCKKDPNYFAIYLDGMDQDKTDIPRMTSVNAREYGKSLKMR
jgi:hypothetical protein